MFDTREKPQLVERAFLIGAYFERSAEMEARSLLAELRELVTTLGIGIVTSMFTAVMVTRMFVALWARHRRPATLPI